MSKQRDEIDAELAEWIGRQRIFFVATAPLAPGAHINLSPKGGDSFRILGPLQVVYQEYTGSGAETAAHLRENGRIAIMFCAFEGDPKILRLHGRGTLLTPEHPRYAELIGIFPPHPGTRSLIEIQVSRVSTSCGFSVPFFEFRGPRETLEEWSRKKTPAMLQEYRAVKNRFSIDGMPAFAAEEEPPR